MKKTQQGTRITVLVLGVVIAVLLMGMLVMEEPTVGRMEELNRPQPAVQGTTVAPTPLPPNRVTAADVSRACGGTFKNLFPPSYTRSESQYYFERKQPYSTLQIYVTLDDRRLGFRRFSWDARQEFFSKTKRTPPYNVTARNFAGDESIFVTDTGTTGALAVIRAGDYVIELEEVQRQCQWSGGPTPRPGQPACALPTCGKGFLTLGKTIVGRLK